MKSEMKGADVSRRRRALKKWWPRLVAIFCILFVWWHVFRPVTFRQTASATCMVEARMWYVAENGAGDSVCIAVTDGHTTDAEGRLCHVDTVCVSGVFVSGNGRLVVPASVFLQAADSLSADSVRSLLLKEKDRLGVLAGEQKEAVKELEYYARTHSVVDDGYNDVMRYGSGVEARQKDVDSLRCLIDSVLAGKYLKVHLRHETSVAFVEVRGWIAPGKAEVRKQRMAATCIRRNKQLALLQTANGRLPQNASFVSLYDKGEETRFRVGYMKGRALPDLLPENVGKQMPQEVTDGLLQIDKRGDAVGLTVGGRSCPWLAVRKFCLAGGALAWFSGDAWLAVCQMLLPVNDRVQTLQDTLSEWPQNIWRRQTENRYFQVVTDSTGLFAGRMAEGSACGVGFKRYADGGEYYGFFEKGMRQGVGTYTDTLQRVYTGAWTADTLPQGLLQDGAARYSGMFNAKLQRHGAGICHIAGQSYYCGQWDSDRRQGFGFAVGERHMVRAGIWKKDNFRGEQMVYTSDRVYGIDISRYQHEIGRKRYGIDWKRLRITRLGVANTARIRGEQNYPVTFVYVKATEGTTSSNRYYAADIAAARRRGLRVGAYHFFSTRTPGVAQARHFIKTARLKRGDLPPVLDVEPSDKQIEAMGGRRALFREMAAWLKVVQAHCGTMPILYISQTFVNKYMVDAPAALLRYQVWIARYGEYKPYVHLLLWQLSPYGRVAGIQGEVDINVFNGSRKQFQRFVAANGVR